MKFESTLSPRSAEPVLVKAENEMESKNLPNKFVKSLIKKVREAHLGLKKKKISMTEKDWKIFRNETVCWLCRKEFEKEGEKMKVRDHCHYTGKYRGAAHLDCNRKFKKPDFTPVFFHNLENYDSHLFVRNLGLEDGVLEVKYIPNNEENFFFCDD